MRTFTLSKVTIAQHGNSWLLQSDSASLTVISEGSYRSWYAEINNLHNEGLLEHFSKTDDIKIEFAGVTSEGTLLSGEAYFHSSFPGKSAALRGYGELHGYESPLD